jgi:uncharacterized membrane protein YcjF (UPF0283 family)
MQIARARAVRRAHWRDGHHHMPLPLRITGLLISIALGLTACDTLVGLFSSSRWIWVGPVLFVLVVVTFLVKRMRRKP